MPPKAQKPSKKNEEKKKEKIIEDKTFGLKNKKGAKQQKFIQHVEHQVKHGGQSAQKIIEQQHQDKLKKKEDKLDELNKLLKPVAELPKIAKDVDPKSVLCVFFKQGLCQKGDRCKWSHDLSIEHKAQKRNIYVDSRDLEKDTMENWDDAKLSEVVEKKHSESNQNQNKTEIICKYFLEALETSKYGWFWECPNGEKCIYRHALPPGYLLKKDQKTLADAEKQSEITLEELIEKERATLEANLPKITLELFTAWKKKKLREKIERAAKEEQKRRTEYKAGRQAGLSGKDIFTFNPDLVLQDDEEAGEVTYTVQEEDETGMEAREINAAMFYTFDVNGELDEFADTASSSAAAAISGGFNEDLFNPDELPDSDSDEESDSNRGSDDSDTDNKDLLKENTAPSLEDKAGTSAT